MSPEDVAVLTALQERSYERAGPGIRESYPRERAMDAERMAAFLDVKRYAVLATTRKDGRPQAAPIAFTVWNGAFWIASVQGARVRNLRAQPYASIVLTHGEGNAHRALVAEGLVTLHPVDFSVMPEGFKTLWKARHGDNVGWAAVFIELHPQRLFSYEATKPFEEEK